jgi:hypothetical protein
MAAGELPQGDSVAHGKRNEEQPQSAAELAPAETLKVGHAGLGSSCWSRTIDSGAGGRCSPARKRSALHGSRPLRKAETRFAWQAYEFLTD